MIKRAIKIILYRLFRSRHQKINPKLIVFESNLGRNYSGNPRAIYEEAIAQGFDERYELVWIFTQPDRFEVPGTCKKLPREKLSTLFLMQEAAALVTDTRQPTYVRKNKESFYMMTWHGTPLKRLGLDLPLSKRAKKQWLLDSSQWDCLLSQNETATKLFRKCFGYEGEILTIGYPRNDGLVRYYTNLQKETKTDIREDNASQEGNASQEDNFSPNNNVLNENNSSPNNNVLNENNFSPNNNVLNENNASPGRNQTESDANETKKNNLPSSKKTTILYAPTWREYDNRKSCDSRFAPPLEFDKILEVLLAKNYELIIKYHYYVKDKPDFSKYQGILRDSDEDIADLYTKCDVMITDYSSTMFDYAILDRPMIFFAYDLERYRKEQGFYFDYEELVPGPIVKNQEELIKTLRLGFEWRDLRKKQKAFREQFTGAEEGTASRLALQRIEKALQDRWKTALP